MCFLRQAVSLPPVVFCSSRFAHRGAEQFGEADQKHPGLRVLQAGHEQRADQRVLPGGLQEERPHLPLLRPTPLSSFSPKDSALYHLTLENQSKY